MAKIIYFTSAMNNEDYKGYLSLWNVPPNLSNQNFHNKFIRSLAISQPVEVVSVRPINANFKQKTLHSASRLENNITWNYVKVSSSRVDKLLCLLSRISKTLEDKIDKDSVIFVDVLNRALLKASIKAANKYGCKAIGVCTDNPHNISFVDSNYASDVLNLCNKLDGYVVLTDKLAALFNPNNKPCLVIDGLTENIDCESNIRIKGDYLFFGGSLMRKYGVYNLIDAFRKLDDPDLKLVICGHHEEEGFISYIKPTPNILYLGALPYQDVNYVQKHALIAINPRPIDPQIDEYSIPSKTLEYLSNGVLTICVNNLLLKERYESAIIWAKTGDVEDLYNSLKEALSLSDKEKEKFINNGIKLTKQYTSLKTINDQVSKLFL